MNNKNVTLIGFGDLGTSFANLIGNKNYEIDILTRSIDKAFSVTKNQKNLFCKNVTDVTLPISNINIHHENFSEIISKSKIIIITRPSFAIPETLELIKKNITRQQKIIIVLTSKGADTESGLTPYKLAQKTFRFYRVSIVVASVIGFAKGIANKELTKVLVSSNKTNEKANRIVRTLLRANYFITEKSHDPQGACLSGLLKNVGAILIGICEGMKSYTYSNGERVTIGQNTRWALVDEYSKEMQAIGKELGIKKSTIEGLSGKIDLGLSCSPKSRNWSFGFRLAKGEDMDSIISDLETIEGIGATKYLAEVTNSRYIKILNKVLNKELSLNEATGIILNDTNIIKSLD